MKEKFEKAMMVPESQFPYWAVFGLRKNWKYVAVCRNVLHDDAVEVALDVSNHVCHGAMKEVA